jgi:hypothetical protein
MLWYRWDPIEQQAVPTSKPPAWDDPEYFEKYLRVALDDFETPFGAVRVSTVFMGLDHSFGDGPPVLWETLVFGGLWDEYQWRYRSRSDAEAGHTDIVKRIKEGRDASESCTHTVNTDQEAG